MILKAGLKTTYLQYKSFLKHKAQYLNTTICGFLNKAQSMNTAICSYLNKVQNMNTTICFFLIRHTI